MKTVFDHIENVKGRPHHIRRKVAVTTAAAVTGLIAFIWLVGGISFGAFAIEEVSFADALQQGTLDVSDTSGSPNLAGAAAAVRAEEAPARIEIVDTAPPESKQKKALPTVIPF